MYGEQETLSILNLLIQHFFNLSRIDQSLQPGFRLTETEMLKLHFAVKELKKGKPIQYITGSTEFLANVTVRRPSRLTLDLGTGTGVQALLTAAHSERVIAVDINPRALAFARFNAQLNGFKNIEFIEGDLFLAVEGQSFDLIISNPPFMISPANQCLYRDNPLEGDELVRNMIREMPRFLNQNGFGQVICN